MKSDTDAGVVKFRKMFATPVLGHLCVLRHLHEEVRLGSFPKADKGNLTSEIAAFCYPKFVHLIEGLPWVALEIADL